MAGAAFSFQVGVWNAFTERSSEVSLESRLAPERAAGRRKQTCHPDFKCLPNKTKTLCSHLAFALNFLISQPARSPADKSVALM